MTKNLIFFQKHIHVSRMQLIYNKLRMMWLFFFFLPLDFLCATFLKNIHKRIFNERGATQSHIEHINICGSTLSLDISIGSI